MTATPPVALLDRIAPSSLDSQQLLARLRASGVYDRLRRQLAGDLAHRVGFFFPTYLFINNYFFLLRREPACSRQTSWTTTCTAARWRG